jgi:hypothetical protein
VATSTTPTPKVREHAKDIVLLFAVPIAIAVIAAVVIYAPRLMANPEYGFAYSYCRNYYCKDSYSIDNNGTIKHNINTHPYTTSQDTAELRYYDPSTDSTKPITFQEASRLNLDTASKSPDGYELVRDDSSSGFLFSYNYSNDWYLENGLKKKKISLTTAEYYSRDVTFLGWVKK